MNIYFSELYSRSVRNVKVQIDLSNYAMNEKSKGATGLDTSALASKIHLPILKTKLDYLDGDKLNPVPSDLSKLSNAVNNDVAKKTVYDKLVTKNNAIDTKISRTTGLVTETRYNLDKEGP